MRYSMVALLVVILITVPLGAQDLGKIVGTVMNSSGDYIYGAELTLTSYIPGRDPGGGCGGGRGGGDEGGDYDEDCDCGCGGDCGGDCGNEDCDCQGGGCGGRGGCGDDDDGGGCGGDDGGGCGGGGCGGDDDGGGCGGGGCGGDDDGGGCGGGGCGGDDDGGGCGGGGCGGDCGGKTTSNEDGGYEFAEIHDGYYRVVVECEGYSTSEEIISVTNGDMILLNFQLVEGRQLSVNDPETQMPESISLVEAYPNPFNSTATISLNLWETASVSAVVYDLSGHKVQTIHQGVLPAGQNRFALNGSNLSVGTYIVRVETPTQSMTKTLSLVK